MLRSRNLGAACLRVGLVLLLALAAAGCETSARYNSGEYYWRKEKLTHAQAFTDVNFCIDSGEAAFQLENKNRNYQGSGGGLLGAAVNVGLYFGSTNSLAKGSARAYDNCMLGLGYQPWALSRDQRKRISDMRANTVRADILAEFMSDPPAPYTSAFPVDRTLISRPDKATASPASVKEN